MRIFLGLYLCSALFLLVIPSPSLAQGGAITIKKDDGTVEVFEIPDAPPAPVQAPYEIRPSVMSAPAAVEKPVVPVKPDMAVEKPAKPAVKKAVKETAKNKVKPKPKAKSKIKKPDVVSPPKKQVKILKEPIMPEPRSLPPGTVVTADLAKSIALEYAPPARSMDAVERLYEGRKVFVVTFATETGPYDVLVDAQTGAVVKKLQRAR